MNGKTLVLALVCCICIAFKCSPCSCVGLHVSLTGHRYGCESVSLQKNRKKGNKEKKKESVSLHRNGLVTYSAYVAPFKIYQLE